MEVKYEYKNKNKEVVFRKRGGVGGGGGAKGASGA